MKSPQRIVSLLPAATEILYGIGLGDRIVAVSHECDEPPDAASKPRVTVSHIDAAAKSGAIDAQVRERVAAGAPLYGLDEEALARLHPDLIVTQSQCDVCAVNQDEVAELARRLDPRGVPVLALNPASLGDVLGDILRVGEAAGARDAAERFAARLRRRVETIRRATGGLSAAERPRVTVIEWIEPLMVAANWTPELVALAGGDYGLAKHGIPTTYTPWDALRRYDPQIVVIAPCGFNLQRTLAEVDSLRALPQWSELSAAQSGRVFAVDGNAYLNRPGPRLVESLELVAHLIHPDRVGPPSLSGPRAWCRL